MPAPELTLRTSGITCRTESYGGPDNDVRLTALRELCVDLQRLARSTLVKIGASDSPASSSASAAPNRLRETRGSQQHPPRNDRPPHRSGKCLADRRGSPHSCRPRAVAGTAGQIKACPDGGRGQKLPKYGGDDIFGVAVGQCVRYQPIRIAVP
jgi:hypothetical protein